MSVSESYDHDDGEAKRDRLSWVELGNIIMSPFYNATVRTWDFMMNFFNLYFFLRTFHIIRTRDDVKNIFHILCKPELTLG